MRNYIQRLYHITKEQDKIVKEAAERNEISESEFIRTRISTYKPQ